MKAQGKKSINISFRLWSSLVQAKSSSGKMLGDLMEECWFARAGEDVNSPSSFATARSLSDNQTVPVNGEHVISDLREALHQMGLAVELAENAIRARSTQGNGEVDGGEAQRTQVADRRSAKGGKARPIRSAV